MVSYCSILKNFYVKDYLKIIWYLNQLFWAFICSTQIFLNSHKSAKNISLTCRVLQTQENKLRRGFGMSERIEARVKGRPGSYRVRKRRTRSLKLNFGHQHFPSLWNSLWQQHPCHQDPESNFQVTNIPVSPTSLSSLNAVFIY